MSIRCFFGIHDYEPFGDGVKLLDILERSAKIKADALYMKESSDEILNLLQNDNEFKTDLDIIRDEICLRCSNILTNIQTWRTAADSKAVYAGMIIKISNERQRMAKEMLYKITKMENCI
jgi:hypothetical protein